MKRLMILAVVALLAIPALSNAVDMTGKYGLGYFNTDAPVGGRIWLTPDLGLDLGIGFKAESVWMGADKETATSFWLEAGFPYVVVATDRANFFVRPGVVFGQLDDRSFGTENLDEKWTYMSFSLTPGAEVFFGDHFSLEAGHGIAIDMQKYPDNAAYGSRAGETETMIRTFDAGLTYLGFHFYFK